MKLRAHTLTAAIPAHFEGKLSQLALTTVQKDPGGFSGVLRQLHAISTDGSRLVMILIQQILMQYYLCANYNAIILWLMLTSNILVAMDMPHPPVNNADHSGYEGGAAKFSPCKLRA